MLRLNSSDSNFGKCELRGRLRSTISHDRVPLVDRNMISYNPGRHVMSSAAKFSNAHVEAFGENRACTLRPKEHSHSNSRAWACCLRMSLVRHCWLKGNCVAVNWAGLGEYIAYRTGVADDYCHGSFDPKLIEDI